MGRRITLAEPATTVDNEAVREFTRLRRHLRACEPGSPAQAVSQQIMAEAIRLEDSQLPPRQAADELRAFIRSLGLRGPA